MFGTKWKTSQGSRAKICESQEQVNVTDLGTPTT